MSVLRKKLRSRRGMSFTELLMAVAMVYAGTMAITYWAGIGV